MVATVALALLAWGVAASSTSEVSLLEKDPPPRHKTIQTLPKVSPDSVHKEKLKQFHKGAKKETVQHQEKLEKRVVLLKERVAALSAEATEEERMAAFEEAKLKLREKRKRDAARHGRKFQRVLTPEEEAAKMTMEVGRVGALMIFGGMLLVACIFFLAKHGNVNIAVMTWLTIENGLAIFAAVMWYEAFDDLLAVGGFAAAHEFVAGLFHTLTLFVLVLYIGWGHKSKHRFLTSITAIGGMYISFAALHTGVSMQEAFFSMNPAASVFGFVILAVICLISSVCVHFMKEKYLQRMNDMVTDPEKLHQQEDFGDAIDEIESTVGGMVLAFAWTMAARYVIMGRYPGEETGATTHSQLERNLFFIYCVFMTVMARMFLPIIDDWIRDNAHSYNPIIVRMMLLLSPFLMMSVAWSYLLWAEFEFYETLFTGNMVMGRLAFAVACSGVCFSIIYAYGTYTEREKHKDLYSPDKTRRELALAETEIALEREADVRRIIVNMLALMIAWSWAMTFSASIECTVSASMHPGAIKIFIALGVACLIIPAYMKLVRPYVENLEDEETRHLYEETPRRFDTTVMPQRELPVDRSAEGPVQVVDR